LRKQFTKTVLSLLEQDDKVVLLLGDIGVHGFKEAFERFPDRVYNIGILEQSMVSLAAGLSAAGMIPIVHTIAPFLVERAFEQIKVDFGYQKLGGNFVSVGASYDYSKLGPTHHCPGDVALLKTIPGLDVMVPGHPEEFDHIFRDHYASPRPTYYRLTEYPNKDHHGFHVKQGTKGTVVAVGPMLDRTIEACKNLDVTINYVTYLSGLNSSVDEGDLVIVEPFYAGTLAHEFYDRKVHSIGVPRIFQTNYGTVQEHDEACELTAPQIEKSIRNFFKI
jgi:transketolase